MIRLSAPRSALLLIATLLSACSGGSDGGTDPGGTLNDPIPGNAEVYVLLKTGDEHYIQHFSTSGSASVADVAQHVTGLPSGEVLIGMDMRPQDGQLYLIGQHGGAASAMGELYTISTPLADDAALSAIAVGELQADPADDGGAPPFSGLDASGYGIDFDPAGNLLRIVGSNGDNLAIAFAGISNPVLVTSDTQLSQTGVVGIAHTHSTAPSTSAPELLAIAADTGTLWLQDPPDAGSLNAPVSLTESNTAWSAADLGFDILTSGVANLLFVAYRTAADPDRLTLATIDRASGAITPFYSSPNYAGIGVAGLAVSATP
ncbi:MAG: DUF4394 domain-containing protein [Nevskiales bacterium]|nr:DUF4394 domain-containing protein [Nevskiales bacterium]